MNINTSLQTNRSGPKPASKAASSPTPVQENKDGKSLVGPALIGGGALAVGAGMLFPDTVSTAFHSVTDGFTPFLQAVAPIFDGAAMGAISGAATGAIYGRLATLNEYDAGPMFAVLGGGLGGLALGAVTGGISAACGVNPLLAVPVTVAAGAALSFMDSRSR